MATAESRRERASPLAYPALLGLGALDAAGYSVIAPTLPVLSEATDAGPFVVGALVASFPMGTLIGFAVAAREVSADRAGRLLSLSLCLLAVGSAGFAFGGDLAVFFACRLMMGLGSGGLWIGIAFATLQRWPGQEYLCMSRIFAAYSVGGLLGPALGAIGGIRGPFLAYLVLVSAGFALVRLLGSPEPRAFGSDAAALREGGFWAASAAVMFAVLPLGIVEGVLPLSFATLLSQAQIGALYVGMSVVVAVSAAGAGRMSSRVATLAGTALAVAGVSLAGAAGSVPLWALGLLLAGAGGGLGETGSLGILLETLGMDRIVLAIVVWSQLGIIGYLAGPLVGGVLAEWLGFASLGLVPLAGAFVVIGLVLRYGSPGRRAEH